MIIFGLDPGTRRTGFGIIETTPTIRVLEAGVIRLGDKDELPQRLCQMAAALNILFERHKPHCTVVEKIFFGKNADSAFKLGHARGVCLLVAGQHQTRLKEWAARAVKKAVTGSGAAEKEQVRWLLGRLLNYTFQTNDADESDALALAYAQARAFEVEQQQVRALGGSV